MEIQEKKSELMERLANVQSPAVLEEIEKILNQDEKRKFNFQEEWEKGLTPEEFMVEMKKRLSDWPRKDKSVEFSFEYNLEEDAKNGLTAEEFKEEMFNRIKKFPWKK